MLSSPHSAATALREAEALFDGKGVVHEKLPFLDSQQARAFALWGQRAACGSD
jgi:hypothetical protein